MHIVQPVLQKVSNATTVRSSETGAQCNCCNDTVWALIVVETEHVARPVSTEIMSALKMAVLNL